MAFKDQINQNVGFFIYNREFLFFSGIIGSPQAFNRFQIIPAHREVQMGSIVYQCTLGTIHNIEIKTRDILKLNFGFRANVRF